MPKLAKNYWVNIKGERKLKCYSIHIQKNVVEETDIKEDDDLVVYSENNKIIISKK